jgi:hypothetical protein
MNDIKPEQTDRNYIIDFVKGFLVVTMVIYHTLNYFLSGYHIIYAYVNYVTLAFIFYSGYMCGTIYFDKFIKNSRYVYTRLAVRGLKLFLLFIFINLIIHALLKKNYNEQAMGISLFLDNILNVLTAGGEKIAQFPILLPISYILLISAPMINLFRIRYLLYFFLIGLFFIISIYDIPIAFNLSCMLTGIGGLLTGLISGDLVSVFRKKYIRYLLSILLFFFLFILIPFGIDARRYYILYFLYVNLIIANCYILGGFLNNKRIITRQIIKLGQYSLMLYLAQILFLQILRRLFDFKLPQLSIDHLIIFVFVSLLLVGCSYLSDYLRNKFEFVDKSYRFIFS